MRANAILLSRGFEPRNSPTRIAVWTVRRKPWRKDSADNELQIDWASIEFAGDNIARSCSRVCDAGHTLTDHILYSLSRCAAPGLGRTHVPGTWFPKRTPMRVAVFTNQFPARLNTFFARDLRALIDCGLEVDVFPFYTP